MSLWLELYKETLETREAAKGRGTGKPSWGRRWELPKYKLFCVLNYVNGLCIQKITLKMLPLSTFLCRWEGPALMPAQPCLWAFAPAVPSARNALPPENGSWTAKCVPPEQ